MTTMQEHLVPESELRKPVAIFVRQELAKIFGLTLQHPFKSGMI
jgi:hypothetical protein